MNVDRIGTFRCRLIEKGISKTKEKGLPQLVARVAMIQLYEEKGGDDGKGKWFDINDWEMETTAYLCLYGTKKGADSPSPTFNYEAVMKVFSWGGVSLAALDKQDHDGLEFQVRITENTYEGARSPFQVGNIAEFDADPVYTIRKLDAKEVKDLDAQFSSIGASSKNAASAKGASKAPAKPHPARVPADNATKTPAKPKGPAKPKAQAQAQTQTADEKKAEMKARSDRVKAQTKKPTASTPPPPDDDNTTLALPEAEGSCTKAESWAGIFDMRDESIDDATVKELWDDAIVEVAGQGVIHKDVTGEQWFQVKDIVIKDCGKF